MSSSAKSSINHFSHPHPLQLINYQPQQTQALPLCAGCKLSVSGTVYSCTACNYFLHVKCSQMPQQITHPSHQGHVLNLLTNPMYPDGLFTCDACFKKDNGFSYHCNYCNFDLHILCASSPLNVTHPSHHHQLSLAFGSPYPNGAFSCGICKNDGNKHWIYRCNMCGFDAHLNCTSVPPPVQQFQSNFGADRLQALLHRIRMIQANQSLHGNAAGRQYYNLQLQQTLQRLFHAASQPGGQGLLAGGGAGGAGLGLLNSISGGGAGGLGMLNGGGGVGGAGVDWTSLMSGGNGVGGGGVGGGGVDWTSLLSGGGGGGGGGVDWMSLLQSFTGGGGGGGSGLDVSGLMNLINGFTGLGGFSF